MVQFIKTYLLTLPVFFGIDLLWLGVIANNLYQEELGHLLKDQPNWIAALGFYLLYIGGITFFALIPSLKEQSWTKALISGALLGLIAYSTYDLSNLATLKDWPLKIVFVDIVWGSLLTGSTAIITYLIAERLITFS